jgi:hypothetical protein
MRLGQPDEKGRFDRPPDSDAQYFADIAIWRSCL